MREKTRDGDYKVTTLNIRDPLKEKQAKQAVDVEESESVSTLTPGGVGPRA